MPAWFFWHHLDRLSSPSLATTGQEIPSFSLLFFVAAGLEFSSDSACWRFGFSRYIFLTVWTRRARFLRIGLRFSFLLLACVGWPLISSSVHSTVRRVAVRFLVQFASQTVWSLDSLIASQLLRVGLLARSSPFFSLLLQIS
jgi:hypothetical protein